MGTGAPVCLELLFSSQLPWQSPGGRCWARVLVTAGSNCQHSSTKGTGTALQAQQGWLAESCSNTGEDNSLCNSQVSEC